MLVEAAGLVCVHWAASFSPAGTGTCVGRRDGLLQEAESQILLQLARDLGHSPHPPVSSSALHRGRRMHILIRGKHLAISGPRSVLDNNTIFTKQWH